MLFGGFFFFTFMPIVEKLAERYHVYGIVMRFSGPTDQMAADGRAHRDIAYYADRLCVTPKYLSETCKSISGSGAAYWINRYTSVEIARPGR